MIGKLAYVIRKLDNYIEKNKIHCLSFNYDNHCNSKLSTEKLINNLKNYFEKVSINKSIIKEPKDYYLILNVNDSMVIIHYSYEDLMFNIIYSNKNLIKRRDLINIMKYNFYYPDTEIEDN